MGFFNKGDSAEVRKLKDKIAIMEAKHKDNLKKLIKIQIRVMRELFNNLDQILDKNTVKVREIKHIQSIPARWELRKLRSEIMRKLNI